jgi:hypothetical protein
LKIEESKKRQAALNLSIPGMPEQQTMQGGIEGVPTGAPGTSGLPQTSGAWDIQPPAQMPSDYDPMGSRPQTSGAFNVQPPTQMPPDYKKPAVAKPRPAGGIVEPDLGLPAEPAMMRTPQPEPTEQELEPIEKAKTQYDKLLGDYDEQLGIVKSSLAGNLISPVEYMTQVGAILDKKHKAAETLYKDEQKRLDEKKELRDLMAKDLLDAQEKGIKIYKNGKLVMPLSVKAAYEDPESYSYGEKPIQDNQGQYTRAQNQEQRLYDRLTKLGTDIDPAATVRTAMGVSKLGFDRAERLQSLFFQFPNLDRRQTEELAIGLNSMLQGSNVSAQQQVQNLVPKTMWGNAKKIVEWITNNPQGLDQQTFTKRMGETIEREKQTFLKQIQRNQYARIAKYIDVERGLPDDFKNVLESNGVDFDDFQKWKNEGHNRIDAVVGGPTNNVNISKSGPKVGDIEDGYRFKGGDPANKNNWAKVQ